MTNFSPGDTWGTIDTTQPMTADHNGVPLECGAYRHVAFQMIWTGATATDGIMTIEGSLDGTTFDPLQDQAYNINSADGNNIWTLQTGALPWLRTSFSHGSNSAGSYYVLFRREVNT